MVVATEVSPLPSAVGSTTVVLGAGASRAVSYAHQGGNLSPLDADFFDLLPRLRNLADNQAKARDWVLSEVGRLPFGRSSLEKSFYTLHLRALMATTLDVSLPYTVEEVVLNFVTCMDAALRAAHSTRTCAHHEKLFDSLSRNDSILTFNYDLVAERALRTKIDHDEDSFDPGIYGFPSSGYIGPPLLKLHGSSNWILEKTKFEVRTKSWSQLDDSPNYRAALGGKGTKFAVFLPFWEKRIETRPWLSVWRAATRALKRATRLISWGYSLPTTDIRTAQLFELSIGQRAIDLCVIDPSPETAARWRALFPTARYWRYRSIEEYFAAPPEWT